MKRSKGEEPEGPEGDAPDPKLARQDKKSGSSLGKVPGSKTGSAGKVPASKTASANKVPASKTGSAGKVPGSKTGSAGKVPASKTGSTARARGEKGSSAQTASSPPPGGNRILLVGGGVAVALVAVIAAVVVATSGGSHPEPGAKPEATTAPAGVSSPAPSPGSPAVQKSPGDTPPAPTPAPPSPKPIPAQTDDERFNEAAKQSKGLIANGAYAQARLLWTEFLKTAKGDSRDAARFELETAQRLEKLEVDGKGLVDALGIAQTEGSHDAALLALATWWRQHVDERGLPPMVRATKVLLDDRHARLVKEATQATERLEAAKASLTKQQKSARPAPASGTWPARLAIVKAATEEKPLEADLTDKTGKYTGTAKGLVVTGISDKGFVLESKARKLSFSWTDRPTLSLQVRKLARRTAPAEAAEDLLADATFFVQIARYEQARALFEERQKLLPGSAVPDVEKIRGARPFVARPTAIKGDASGRSRFAWAFEDDGERNDFTQSLVHGDNATGTISVGSGKLVFRDAAEFATIQLAHDLDVGPGTVEIECELYPLEKGPFVGIDFLHEDGSRTSVHASVEWGKRIRVASLVSHPKPAAPAGQLGAIDFGPSKWDTNHEADFETKKPTVVVKLVFTPGGAPGELWLDGKKVPWSAGPPALPAATTVTPRVGKLAGVALTTSKLSVTAPLRPGWLRKLDEEYERVLAHELGGNAPSRRVGLPPVTSADDTFATAGLPPKALAAFKLAREALAKGDDEGARAALDEAALAAAPYPAALLLRASLDVEQDPHKALDDCEQILAFLPDCHEALALRGLAWANLGQGDRARADVAAVLEIRPDAALAYLARGMIGLAQRKPEEPATGHDATADLELASALAPDDPVFAKKAALGIQVLRGPWPDGGSRRKVTEHYVVVTDTEEASLEAIGKDLETAWAGYAKRFPPRGTWRRAEVLVFNTRGAYADWAGTFSPDLARGADGYYDPSYDQLVLFEPLWDHTHLRTREVTFHEAFHQYARRVLPAMPVWLDEGLATYFGMEAAYDGRPEHQVEPLRRCLSKPFGLAEWAKYFVGSHAEFHDGKHDFAAQNENYARAWVVATSLLEGKGKLAGVLGRLLERMEAVPSLHALVDVLDDATLAEIDRQFRARATALCR